MSPDFCASGKLCGVCAANPEFRATVAASIGPFSCPRGLPWADAPPQTAPESARKSAICRACPLLGTPECCGCPEARARPWTELLACRHGKWSSI